MTPVPLSPTSLSQIRIPSSNTPQPHSNPVTITQPRSQTLLPNTRSCHPQIRQTPLHPPGCSVPGTPAGVNH